MKPKKPKKSRRDVVKGFVDLNEVERLLEFITEHGLEEFEYAKGDLKVRLKRSSAATPHLNPITMVPPEILVQRPGELASESHRREAQSVAATEGGETARAEDLHVVKSPIVGTFYNAPSPGAEPFVKAGDHVGAGQVLCIVEAMKLMNEIESDAAGEVLKIFVENGQPVEYGEPLFGIRPSRKK